jgi:isoamylase
LRFNRNKLLLDPYAKGIGRELKWADELFGYQIGHPEGDLSFDERDSAPFAPLAMVVDGNFDWADEKRPNVPWHETVIYEAHVRGMTKLHPDIPEPLRGTYAGMASDPILQHLKKLGVTAMELMPVHHFLHDRFLIEKGLRNYWGYNTLSFFAPEPSYATQRAEPENVIKEFKEMVMHGCHLSQNGLNDRPCGLDAVLTREECAISCHGVAQEPLVGISSPCGWLTT